MESELYLEGKKVLMVLAHCDDEIVCGWPILQNVNIHKSIIIISSDRNNRQRQWCSHRKFVTQDLCKKLGIDLCVLDYPSDFYSLSHRAGHLITLENEIINTINGFEFDYIFTHNPFGEYGHLDHIFIFNLLYRAIDRPTLISDTMISSDWSNMLPMTPRYDKTYYSDLIGNFTLDDKFYKYVVRFYETRGVWTWPHNPIKNCCLYLI